MGFTNIGHHLPEFYIKNFPKEWDEYTKFSIIRNPWDRFVSNYEYGKMSESYWHSISGNTQYGPHLDFKKLSNLTFKETLQMFYLERNSLKHQGWGNQHPYIFNSDGKMILDYVFKLDEIIDNTEFNMLVPNMIHKNKSKRKLLSYKDYYDEEMIDMVAQIYHEDIKLLNFKF